MIRKVLISAGSLGIERCIAEAFLDQHDEISVCDINAENLTQFQQSYPALHILASESGCFISGQVIPIDGDKQCLS